MHFIFFLILFYQTTLALVYNDKCTTKCNFPGMVCVNNRCICDSKNRLFWTNARCAPCPNDWTMTETACIVYYDTAISWETAKLTCRNVKAELISFRNTDMISLLSIATNKNQFSGSNDKLTAWTSARATDFAGFGVYQWLDKNVNPFNDKSNWWCKKTTPNLGYTYASNEPTRYSSSTSETEACVVYRRSTTNTQVACLDDQLCSQKFPFVCEKSESTSTQYLGPPPVVINLFNASTNVGSNIIHTINSPADTIIINTANRTPQPKKTSTGVIIIIVVISILLLLALPGCLFFFLKRRNATETEFNINRSSKVADPASKTSDTSTNDTIIKDELIHPDTNTNDGGLVLDSWAAPDNVVVNTGAQKSRRGGYSKQQFDEFE